MPGIQLIFQNDYLIHKKYTNEKKDLLKRIHHFKCINTGT